MNKELLLEVKKYIEDTELNEATEYGNGESLEELIEKGYMPDLYGKILDLLK